MAFDWGELLPLAEEFSGERRESVLRTSLGRAYYAAYHAARTYALSRGCSDSRGHRRLWEWFETQASERLKLVSSIGQESRRWRELADYDAVEIGEIQRVAQEQIARARELRLLLEQDASA